MQNYAPANPRPYDDTGWTFQYMRNVTVTPVADKSDPRPADDAADRGRARRRAASRAAAASLVVEHTTDNNLMTFRFEHADVKMQAAEEDFEAAGRKFRAGAFIIPGADRAALEPTLEALGLSAWAVAAAPSVKTHDLDVPRIGYVHAWQRTQDEGWVRAALDTYGVPYTYFGDIRSCAKATCARSTTSSSIPHVGGTPQAQVNGIPKTGTTPLPYRKTDGHAEPRRARPDRRHPRRHGHGRADGAGEVRASRAAR